MDNGGKLTVTVVMTDGRTEKLTFTCTKSAKAYLKEWAHRERLSISTLVEGIVLTAIQHNRKDLAEQSNEPSIADLIRHWDLRKLAEEALMPIEDLEKIVNGERPTDDDLICLGRVLTGFDTVALLQIRKRDFPLSGNGERKHG